MITLEQAVQQGVEEAAGDADLACAFLRGYIVARGIAASDAGLIDEMLPLLHRAAPSAEAVAELDEEASSRVAFRVMLGDLPAFARRRAEVTQSLLWQAGVR